MKKIETLFLRDLKGRALPTVNPGCEWVLEGEGVPTKKIDGTCCLVKDGVLYKRMEWSQGRGEPPAKWMHHTFDPAQRSGHGWLPVNDGPEDWMHRKGLVACPWILEADCTCELIGPCIGKNPQGMEPDQFAFVVHGLRIPDVAQRTFETLRAYLEEYPMEGIVWWHSDGRMCKIKRKDYGIPWPVKR